jgi:hypothetical protein
MRESFIRCLLLPDEFNWKRRQSDSGSSNLSAKIMSRCWNKIGSKAASICGSRDSNAARVGPSIWHCSGGSGTNIAMEVAL